MRVELEGGEYHIFRRAVGDTRLCEARHDANTAVEWVQCLLKYIWLLACGVLHHTKKTTLRTLVQYTQPDEVTNPLALDYRHVTDTID